MWGSEVFILAGDAKPFEVIKKKNQDYKYLQKDQSKLDGFLSDKYSLKKTIVKWCKLEQYNSNVN